MTALYAQTPRVAAILATIVGSRTAAARTTRAGEVLDCVRSLQANSYAPLEIIVVDQSRDDTIAAELRPLLSSDTRLHYLHTDIAGKTHAQNLAVRGSSADLFAFTDDDCIVSKDWVACIVETFRRHPDAGLLYGEVLPPPDHDWAASFVPAFRIAQEHRLRPTFLPRATNLFGANMAASRPVFARVGLFDEALGPGAQGAQACEEIDFYLRVMRAGIGIYLTPAFSVVHKYGSRLQGEATRQLLRTYEKGKVAVQAKHASRGDLGAACKLALLAFEPFVNGAINLLRTGRPRGAGMIVPYVEGLVRGVRIARRSAEPTLIDQGRTAPL